MSSFAVSNLKGVKVYNLTFGKTAEQWKEEQRAGNIRSLRYNEGMIATVTPNYFYFAPNQNILAQLSFILARKNYNHFAPI